MIEAGTAEPEAGLTQAEAARRLAARRRQRGGASSSRTVGDILRANLLTRFNALLGSLLVVVLVVGPPQDAFFGMILVANTAIGIAEELRAKLTLDHLALLHAPTARVMRDGELKVLPAAEIVEGDAMRVLEGDEVVADSLVLSSQGLEMNEALLSGEATPVAKREGEELLAGSFVVAGTALLEARRVGDDSYAAKVALQARRFQLVRSELMRGINRILRFVTWLIAPMAVLLIVTQLRANPSLEDAARASVAGLITLVPEGLVLLTSLSLAVSVVQLGRRRVLIQQLAAVEMLARADLVCLDKTGTLTDGTVRLELLLPLTMEAESALALSALVALEPHGEMRSLAQDLPPPPSWRLVERIPFSSGRRWSAAGFEGRGTWVLGAPEALLPGRHPVLEKVEEKARLGARVLLLGRAGTPPRELSPAALEPVALVLLREGVRAEARGVLEQLHREGVKVVVLSGDHEATVTAVAESLGLGEESGAEVHGRVLPEDKARLVEGYRRQGRVVAMVGDGVNDVLALKAADIGLAVGEVSTAARAVSAVVLLGADFGAIPQVIKEGRRVIGNVERLASLFVTKTAYAAILGIASAVFLLPFPFLPRHLTLIAAFTIGIPAFFLALAPNAERARPGFLKRVLTFSVPAGLVAAVFTFAGYFLALAQASTDLVGARTVATIVLSGLSIWVLALLARPLTPPRWALLALMAVALFVSLVWPLTEAIFGVSLPGPELSAVALGLILGGGLALMGSLAVASRLIPQDGPAGAAG